MQSQKVAPPDMQCKDKFLLQSVVASPGATAKDITPEMFNNEAGHHVEECKLRVLTPLARDLIPKLTEEKNSVIQQNNRLQQELELLRRQTNRCSTGIPFIYVVIVGLIVIILGVPYEEDLTNKAYLISSVPLAKK